MVILNGTKTEKNLKDAFAGESQARNRYTYFAAKAKSEGLDKIAAIFEESAINEREHAKMWFKLLSGGDIPATPDNLIAAAAGEHEEWTAMYKRMADEAREDGFNGIAYLFDSVAKIEKEHEERFLMLTKELTGDAATDKKEKTIWICSNCGHILDDDQALDKCPVCDDPQAVFTKRVVNY